MARFRPLEVAVALHDERLEPEVVVYKKVHLQSVHESVSGNQHIPGRLSAVESCRCIARRMTTLLEPSEFLKEKYRICKTKTKKEEEEEGRRKKRRLARSLTPPPPSSSLFYEP
jgi:hypothetical protein